VAFRGNLAGMDLEEVFGFLAGNGSEGTLEVRSGDAASIRLYFRPDGQVFFPFSARRGTYSLGKLLRHTGVLSRESLEEYLSEVKRQRKAQLLQSEAGEGDLEDARRRQFTEELHDLFLWRDAQYEFLPGPLPPRVAQDLEAGRGLTFEPQSLLFEVARRKDERRRIQHVIPSSRLVLQARPGRQALVIEALNAGGIEVDEDPFSGDLRLDDLLGRWGVPHHLALSVVAALVEAGHLLLLSGDQARTRVQRALERGDGEAACRLLGHLLELEWRGEPGPEGPFQLGAESLLVGSEAFGSGPELSCAMRLGGARAFRLAAELFTARRTFTLSLHTSGARLVISCLPAELTLAVSRPSAGVASEASEGDALRRAVDELAAVVLWPDVDATLTNRKTVLRKDEEPLSVAFTDAQHQEALGALGRWQRRLEQVPGEDAMFLPGGTPAGKGGAAKFLSRFSLRRTLGELRREAKAQPLEFVRFVSKALKKGFLRRPELYELQAAVAGAREDRNDTLVYRLARAGVALGHGADFAPVLAEFHGREPVLYGAPALQGDLDGIGLAAVLQALHDQRRTGTLVVSAGAKEERLLFSRGDAFVLRGGRDDEGEEFLDFFLGDEGEEQVSALAGAGAGFVPQGTLSAAEMRELKDEFLDLLFWEEASFTFYPDDLPDGFFQPAEDHVDKIALETRGFLLEAMHHMAEWDRIREHVPSVTSVFRFVEGRKGQEIGRRAAAAPTLMLIDGRLSVRDLVRVSGEQLLEVGRLLSTLVRSGALELVEPDPELD
jgi:hypothetical protein